jgi:hypothetical protein
MRVVCGCGAVAAAGSWVMVLGTMTVNPIRCAHHNALCVWHARSIVCMACMYQCVHGTYVAMSPFVHGMHITPCTWHVQIDYGYIVISLAAEHGRSDMMGPWKTAAFAAC